MKQEEFGKLIKNLRKKHNLTQKGFADKYNVTYQAVSKWENGKNMPDTFLLQQISNDFDISLEELLGSSSKPKKNKTFFFIVFSIVVIFLMAIFFYLYTLFKSYDFEFKTITTNCDNFNISGSVSYNKNKSAIYITNVKYCGGDVLDEFQTIECVLYETDGSLERKISTYKYHEEDLITLEEFLQNLTLSIDNYEQICREYDDDNLYLIINATKKDNETITYRIPLILNEEC